MKKTLLALLCVGFVASASAQVIISQDFQDYQNFEWVTVPDDAAAEDWINYDADALADANARPQDWFVTDDFRYVIEEYDTDTNFMMASSSWLEGFLEGNRNYLILPELDIDADNIVISWTSSTRQAPRYADGYSLVVSPDAEVADPTTAFTDFLFRASQMVSIDGDGSSLDYNDFTWNPTPGDGFGGTGYLHADNFTDLDYLILDDIYIGKLEPHVMSLAAYEGETIRIAFLHDSDDDNLIGVDDILVEYMEPTGLIDYSFEQLLDFYPNPASDVLNLSFSNLVKDQAVVNIYNAMGTLVMTQQFAGNELTTVQNINVNNLAAGFYSIQVSLDNKANVGSSFIKN
jgi:hypothetical protein